MNFYKKGFYTTKDSQYNDNKFCENKIGEDLITKPELAKLLNMSVSNVNKLMKQRRIPYLKIGRLVRFKYSEVVAALTKGSAV